MAISLNKQRVGFLIGNYTPFKNIQAGYLGHSKLSLYLSGSTQVIQYGLFYNRNFGKAQRNYSVSHWLFVCVSYKHEIKSVGTDFIFNLLFLKHRNFSLKFTCLASKIKLVFLFSKTEYKFLKEKYDNYKDLHPLQMHTRDFPSPHIWGCNCYVLIILHNHFITREVSWYKTFKL